VRMTNTTTVDCVEKILAPTTEHTRTGKAPMIVKGAMQQRNNNKNKTNPTSVFEEVLSRLDIQNCGRITCLQGKPRICKKDIVKRRKEKERVLVMMRFANLRENRVSGKRLGSRIALRLKFPVYYPPVGVTVVRIQLPIGQGACTKGKRSTYL
jgi:hypothetical protein